VDSSYPKPFIFKANGLWCVGVPAPSARFLDKRLVQGVTGYSSEWSSALRLALAMSVHIEAVMVNAAMAQAVN